MPVAFARLVGPFNLRALPRSASSWFIASFFLLFMATAWGVVGGRAAADTIVRPLYPAAPGAVEMVDVSHLSVVEVVEKLPIALRFELLLHNAGLMSELTGDGAYTLFVPADNYFDYLPLGWLAQLSRSEMRELAAHHIVPRVALGLDSSAGSYLTLAGDTVDFAPQNDQSVVVDNGFAIKGYRASNGVVYLMSRVLLP